MTFLRLFVAAAIVGLILPGLSSAITPPPQDIHVWTSLNHGSGSGLDADLLDGLDSSTFLDAITNETSAREKAFHALLDSLALEIDERRALQDAVHDALAAEAATRAAADAALVADLSAETAARGQAIEALLDALAVEIGQRQALWDALQQAIAAEAAARSAADATLASNLTVETMAREQAILNLLNALALETAEREALEEALQHAIAAEAAARSAADSTLASALSAETAAREQAIQDLLNALALEIAARQAGDDALQHAIAAEASARATADAILTSAITAETTAREHALTALAEALASEIAALQARATQLEGFVNGGHFRGTTLGLGTSSPDATIDAVGGILVAPGIPGCASNVGYSFRGVACANSGMFYGAAGGKVQIRSNGATGVVVTQNGDVGIKKANPSAALDVNGAIHGSGLRSTDGMDITGTSILRSKAEILNTLYVSGKAGIGKQPGAHQLEVKGSIASTQGIFANQNLGAGDVAEPVVGLDLAPGDVVILDGFTPEGKLRVAKAREAHDARVVGIVSTTPSITLAGLPTDTPLAVTGIVPVKVVGPVKAGDLLTSSSLAGHAMACEDAASCFGATIGKALESSAGGEGVVRAIVLLG